VTVAPPAVQLRDGDERDAIAHQPAGDGNARHPVGRDNSGKGVISWPTVPSFPSPCGLHEFAAEGRHGDSCNWYCKHGPDPAGLVHGIAAAREAFGRRE
jgi:hypothetical protein